MELKNIIIFVNVFKKPSALWCKKRKVDLYVLHITLYSTEITKKIQETFLFYVKF